MAKNIIVLPNKEQIIENLNKVSGDDHIQRLWNKIAVYAGQNKVALGVILLIELSIHDYTVGMPKIMANLLDKMIPQIIGALVSDPEQYKECIATWEQVNKAADVNEPDGIPIG